MLGKIILQMFMYIHVDMLMKFNCVMPVLAAFMVSKCFH